MTGAWWDPEALAQGVRARPPVLLEGPGLAQAGVAIVLAGGAPAHGAAPAARAAGGDAHLLLIERAAREGDPWSGHLACPGGKFEPGDTDLAATVRRETLEEVGLDLAAARPVGRLDDRHGFTRPIAVASFVYLAGAELLAAPLLRTGEVEDAFWVPLGTLFDPARQDVMRVDWRGRAVGLPAVRLFDDPARPLLWGLTYRLLESLWARVDRGFPAGGVTVVRRERPGDEAGIDAVERAAFGRRGEADLVEALRARGAVTASWVAEDDDGRIAAHALFSPAWLEAPGGSVPLVALGPVAVEPSRQGRGLGAALLRRGLDELRAAAVAPGGPGADGSAAGAAAVIVLGDPAYYARFGFVPAARHGIDCRWDVPEGAFQVLELSEGSLAGLAGRAHYAPEFDAV